MPLWQFWQYHLFLFYLVRKNDRQGEGCKRFTGTYKSVEQWLDEGDYLVDVKFEYEKLVLVDTIEEVPYYIIPTDSISFIDSDSGTKFLFDKNDKSQITGFKFAGTYQFEKIK